MEVTSSIDLSNNINFAMIRRTWCKFGLVEIQIFVFWKWKFKFCNCLTRHKRNFYLLWIHGSSFCHSRHVFFHSVQLTLHIRSSPQTICSQRSHIAPQRSCPKAASRQPQRSCSQRMPWCPSFESRERGGEGVRRGVRPPPGPPYLSRGPAMSEMSPMIVMSVVTVICVMSVMSVTSVTNVTSVMSEWIN